jgi:tRNA(fMet)-specific endonuclease VapC
MTYLADTSWVVEHFRGNQEVTDRLNSLGNEVVSISIITVAELYVGAYRSSNLTRTLSAVRDFIGKVVVLDINDDICLRFGREKAVLLDKGQPIGDADLLIAATALHHGLTLLTRDLDFERIDDLQTVYL